MSSTGRATRNPSWQVADGMTWAKQAAFTDRIELGTAVRAFDDSRADHPMRRRGSRAYRTMSLRYLRRCSPDRPAARQPAPRVKLDLTFIISDYDSMVAVSDIPMQVEGK